MEACFSLFEGAKIENNFYLQIILKNFLCIRQPFFVFNKLFKKTFSDR